MTPTFAEALQLNLVTPGILFFVLGLVAAVLKSDLKFPEPIYAAMTIYLLVAIGFKGGVSLSKTDLGSLVPPVGALIALGALIPAWCYPVLRRLGRLSPADAAAIACHYGSVSAMTFLAGTNFLTSIGMPYEPHTVAFLAVMESPAIIVGILIGRLVTRAKTPGTPALAATVRAALYESVTGKSVVLLVGAMLVGWACGPRGAAATEGFFVAPFQGILALFLLEMGLVAGHRLRDLRHVGLFLVAFGVLAPIFHGTLGIFIAYATGLSVGSAVLVGLLAASASYIAAPATVRTAIPEANPTFYLTAALVITFPFNITLGIPLYHALARAIYGG